jgi:hypothetical protein
MVIKTLMKVNREAVTWGVTEVGRQRAYIWWSRAGRGGVCRERGRAGRAWSFLVNFLPSATLKPMEVIILPLATPNTDRS